MVIDNDLARRIGNAIIRLNADAEKREERAEKREERREKDHAELRSLLGNLDKSLALLSGQLSEARHDIEDLTPPLGIKLEGVPVKALDVEDSWKHQMGAAVALARRIWPIAKTVIHIASAVGGGAIVARLFVVVFGHR